LDDWLKNRLVRNVVNAIAEREVNSIILAGAHSNIAQLAGPGKELAVFMERHRHDSVCCVKRLFNTIAMVDINIDIEHALIEAKKLDNPQDDI
jgi:hypothetical protein